MYSLQIEHPVPNFDAWGGHSRATLSIGSSQVYAAIASYDRLTIQTTPSSTSNSTA